jgi:Zn-finger nucleic acid-binding protein
METRWPCPVCLGATLEKVVLAGRETLTLDHCPRCGGVWLERGEVAQLRARRPEALWAGIERRAAPKPRCHSCHTHLDADADRCPACGHRVQLHCPPCQHPTDRARHGDLTLDVCRRCQGVWFDHHELAGVWKLELDRSLALRRSDTSGAEVASWVLLDALTYSPGLVFYGAHAATEVVAAAAHGVGNAPGVLGAAVEVAGNAAEGVFEVLLEAVAAIFDGLG